MFKSQIDRYELAFIWSSFDFRNNKTTLALGSFFFLFKVRQRVNLTVPNSAVRLDYYIRV